MRVDVSEIKTFKTCRRQWQLSSRNRFHLRPTVAAPALAFGTIFHEALAQMYLGVNIDKVMEMVRREMRTDTDAALLAMVPGYYKNVLPDDLDRFKVLDVEHHFEIAPTTSEGEYLFPLVEKRNAAGEIEYDSNGEPIMEPSLTICGSIDLIALDTTTNEIWGFEHKTCKDFRDETFLWMDEQPRVYTWAMQEYVRKYNDNQYKKWVDTCCAIDSQPAECRDEYPGEPTPVTLGGVYLNEVKKLLRSFQYNRTKCVYSTEDLDMFMQTFYQTCTQCKHMVDNNNYAAPQPSYFACKMCSFKTICQTYMYENLDKDAILKEFTEEFVERSEDHLDEKTERSTSND